MAVLDVQQLVRTLESLLDEECKLYTRYLEIIAQERQFVAKFNSEKVSALSAERGELCERMKEAQAKRKEIMEAASGGHQRKLSEFIKTSFSPPQAKRLMVRVEKLKSLVGKCQSKSSEFGQVVGFSLNLVSGLLSILWSATQNVVRGYGASGKIKESYHPARSRAAGLLKEV